MADSFLKDVIMMFVRKKHSLASLIQHSEVWSTAFRKHAEDLEHSVMPDSVKHLRNLRAAMHRLESWSTPTARVILLFRAYMLTAVAVATQCRGRKEGMAAQELLAWITEERALQLAMLADASDEGLLVIRSLDSESTDPAKLAGQLSHFRAAMDELFIEGKVCNMRASFTGQMLESLQESILIPGFANGGAAKVLGGATSVTQAIQGRCLQRMRCFTSLAMSVVSAEFPHWEILQSFRAFALETRDRQAALNLQANATLYRDLSRLAQLCNVNPDTAIHQYKMWFNMARKRYESTPGSTYLQAWAATLRLVLNTRRKSRRQDMSCLGPIIVRYSTYTGMTTSGIEGNNSHQNWMHTKRRGRIADATAEDELKLVVDLKEGEHDIVIKEAQRAWKLVHAGTRRVSTGPRLVKKTHKLATKTYAKWLQARRSATKALGEAAPKRSLEDTRKRGRAAGAEEWTEASSKEGQFNDLKRLKTFYQQVHEGTILPDELDDGDVELAAQLITEMEAARVKLDKQRDKHAKQLAKRGTQLADLHSAKVFSAGVDVQPLHSVMQRLSMQSTTDRIAADVYLAINLMEPGQRTLWAVALTGGIVAVPRFLETSGAHGACLRYRPAVSIKRLVWVSGDFYAHHPELGDVVDRAVASRGSKWVRIPSAAMFLEAVRVRTRGPVRQHRLYEAVALVTVGEKRQQARSA